MAYTNVYLTNGIKLKKAPVGFSWTTFFFGFWPAVFRSDWLWAVILFIACLLTYGVAAIVFAFFYNKIYINRLLDQGYVFSEVSGITDEELKRYLSVVHLPRVVK